jgi:hypothetical protein
MFAKTPVTRFRVILPTLVLAISLPATVAKAATLPPETASYSADAILELGDQHFQSTVVADHGRERRVVETPYGPQTVILDLAGNKAFLIQPTMGAFSMDLASAAAGLDFAGLYETPVQPLGHEILDGLKVTKFRVSARPARNAGFDGFVWSTDDGIIVRVDGEGTYRNRTSHLGMRLGQIRRAAQDPSAFSLPPGLPVLNADSIVKLMLREGPAQADR